MPQGKTAKAQYSEYEAALEVGVSVEELRTLVNRIAGTDEVGMGAMPGATYQASDLVMLKILARMSPQQQQQQQPTAAA
ncbi:hypothetical protein F183_A40010 [Bryobacterales bacterium F-183]|nr:hypothetical protein F183_A40010 [Bryobacterales bacterium F-183]